MQEARLRDLMADLHDSFKDRVRSSRGPRLAAGRDDELFSGGWLARWLGAPGLALALAAGCQAAAPPDQPSP